MKSSRFIQQPAQVPARRTTLPRASTMFLPSVRKKSMVRPFGDDSGMSPIRERYRKRSCRHTELTPGRKNRVDAKGSEMGRRVADAHCIESGLPLLVKKTVLVTIKKKRIQENADGIRTN